MQPSDIGTLIALADKLGPWLTLIALVVFWYFRFGHNGKHEIMENCKTQVATCKERFSVLDAEMKKSEARCDDIKVSLYGIDKKIAIISTHLGVNGALK